MSEDKAFFDTNVLVYLLSDDRVKADRSEQILAAGGTVSVQVLNEFAAVARRKFHLRWTVVRETLTTVGETCAVVPLTIDTHTRAMTISERTNLNLYDGLILAAAALSGCAVVYSEDMQDGFAVDGVRVCNPYVAD